MTTEITNNKLGKIFTLEFMGMIAAMAFAVGTTYTTLADGQEKTDAKVAKIEGKQETIENVVQQIKIDTATMRVEQQHLKEEMQEQQGDIKRILDILEQRNP